MNRRDAAWLVTLAAVFLAWHVPLEYRTCAGQDEDWYAATGVMTLRDGLPSIPYMPARDPASAAYKADVVLYVLPPLNGYIQAAVHLFLGDGVGPARLASTLAGLAAVWLVYALARAWFDDRRAAVLAATAFVASRAFTFPATTARPDMATATFGLLALLLVVRHGRDPRGRWLAAAGAAAGLSLLCHPYGVVPATQCGLTVLSGPGGVRRRLRDAALLTAVALAVFALWVPLIALHPDIFRAQFGAGVLARAGPGVGKTAVSLRAVLTYQAVHFWEFVHAPQALAYLVGTAWLAVRAGQSAAARGLLAQCAVSALLLAVLQGLHTAIGYYVYPVALLSVAVGLAASDLATFLERAAGAGRSRARGAATTAAVALLLALFLPGAGLRTLYAHVRHARDPNYDAHALARAVLADVPPSALVAVDGAYVLDFYLARRPVVELAISPLVLDVRDYPFDYAVLGPISLGLYRARMTDLVFVKSYGDPTDPFAPYAELYRRDRRPVRPTPSTGMPSWGVIATGR